MTHYLDAAIEAARAAGDLLRQNFHQPLRVNVAEAHDIKLEIDVRTQELIDRFPPEKLFRSHALYGEEGIVGDQDERVSMGGGSDRWHRELFLRHSAFLHFDRAPSAERNHRRRDLRSDARRDVDCAKRRDAEIERIANFA